MTKPFDKNVDVSQASMKDVSFDELLDDTQ